MKVAIVHDWLTQTGGAERVLEQLLALYPQADLFCLLCFLRPEDSGFLGGRVPRTSFLQRMPFARKRYRAYLPLMPLAIEQFDLSGYDLVISSSYAVAKGVLTGPDQVHVAYVHSPIRYAWDLQHAYLAESGLTRGVRSIAARMVLHYIRLWDTRTAHSPDLMVGNSQFVARRIRKAYGRAATVIYPPVATERFICRADKEDFYLTASRMVPYKRIPLLVEAFTATPRRRLVVIGDGPEMVAVRRQAGPNVTLLGRQPDAVVADHMQRARAFVFAAEEDFGIVPIEAQACGTPVIAYGRGGSLETIRADGPDPTGIFFDEQSVASVVSAVDRFEALDPPISAAACRANAERFATARFGSEFAAAVAGAVADHDGIAPWR